MPRIDADLPADPDPDDLYDAFTSWAHGEGISPYPHQDEAVIELFSGGNVVLATPTGSGKSLVAIGACLGALARDQVAFYTAPIKALVSEKFFAMVEVFGAENVGLLTGDASVNPDAPIICCTAEVLANIALREGRRADVGVVVMDEFHFYADPQRGWAWQVPLLELPQAQFLLMSATLGDVSELSRDLSRRNGRETVLVDDARRPVPLSFTWAMTPLEETLDELLATQQAPVYVVHFTQAAAVEHATSLLKKAGKTSPEIAEAIGGFRFAAGFGRTLSTLLRRGIGVHHAGMLPKYRRLVEQLAQRGLLRVICGTDTLGVGIDVPIRTVLFTGLAKYDGTRQRVVKVREFQQIAGRAGRPGYDVVGTVVVQAPEHVIENHKARVKAEAKNRANPKKNSKAQVKKPPPGTIVWTEDTFTKLVEGRSESLQSRMKVDNAMLVNVIAREEDALPVLRRLLMDNHEPRRQQLRLARRALRLTRSLVHSQTVTRLEEPDGYGRRYVLTLDLPEDFALNQPLAHFALEALELLDPDSPEHPLDVVSVVESVLEGPRQILFAQQHVARGEAIAAMKADGIEYDERMELLEQVTWPQPLAELLEPAYQTYRQHHPWLPEDALEPKSIVREMVEQGMGFTEFVSRYQLARSEGLVLRYLSDAFRTLRQTVPAAHRTEPVEDLIEWLGETVRQVDSSLLDEWEALVDPEHRDGGSGDGRIEPAVPRPISQQERAFTTMVRNVVFRFVLLAARDDVPALAALTASMTTRAVEAGEGTETDPGVPEDPGAVLDAEDWDQALESYYADHDEIRTDADARGPGLFQLDQEPGRWRVRQTLADPAGDRDWVIEADVDLAASDRAGEAVVLVRALRRLDQP